MKILRKIKLFLEKHLTISINESEPGFLLGVDLSKWQYLGSTEIATKNNEALSYKTRMYYFLGKSKENKNQRKYIRVQ